MFVGCFELLACNAAFEFECPLRLGKNLERRIAHWFLLMHLKYNVQNIVRIRNYGNAML